jgi:hypothetical protein
VQQQAPRDADSISVVVGGALPSDLSALAVGLTVKARLERRELPRQLLEIR